MLHERVSEIVGAPVALDGRRLPERWLGDRLIVSAATEWIRLQEELDGPGCRTDAHLQDLIRQQLAQEATMHSVVARNLEGLQSKARVLAKMMAGPDGRIEETEEDDIGLMSWSIADDLSRFRSLRPPEEPTPEDLQADALWQHWYAEISFSDGPHNDLPEDEREALSVEIGRVELRIRVLPPSPMRAAATCLVEAYHQFTDERPINWVADDKKWLALHTLESLRPVLKGAVARCAADLLDHRDRPLGESALHNGPVRRPALLVVAE